MRESGILCPIFTLSSKFGIGCLSKESYEFIDFLHESGQGYWQILPVGPTGYGNSPYQPISAFAGNPYFISPEKLIEEGLLSWDDVNRFHFGSDEECVDYGALYENRYPLMQIAYDNFVKKGGKESSEYHSFIDEQAFWLDDYCLYRALKLKYNGKSWQEWDEDIKLRDKNALLAAATELADSADFFRFQQFKFSEQWNSLLAYAKSKNIKIIGDIPFYVSLDSADVWAHPEVFQMDKDLTPTVVAGCPPDAFSLTGQLWGNPIYDWEYLENNNFDWWIKRIQRSYELYDVIRIDHFHGFAEYYAIPFADENAVNGTSHKGPGTKFFNKLKEITGDFVTKNSFRIIAEDLGTVTKENQKLLEETNIPGMKILQYAFTSWDSIYMPYKHIRNCVVYTGTHDNMTTRNWIDCINEGERGYLRRYLNSMNSDYGALTWDIIRECYRSVSDLCIIPIQDYLVKGHEARINTPGSGDGNWQWRLKPNFLSHELAGSIRLLAETYGRIPKQPSDSDTE